MVFKLSLMFALLVFAISEMLQHDKPGRPAIDGSYELVMQSCAPTQTDLGSDWNLALTHTDKLHISATATCDF